MQRQAGGQKRLRLLRNQGRVARGSFVHPALGANFRITDIQAALGLAQFDKLPAIIARKRALLACYRAALAGVAQVAVLEASDESEAVPFRAVLLCERVAELVAHLEAAGVQTRRCFYPLHRQPCFAHLGDSCWGSPRARR